jgi:hypothetical protein
MLFAAKIDVFDVSDPAHPQAVVDLLGHVLPLDPLGADLEGLAIDHADGSFWMADEYRPAIYHFDSHGVLLKRYIPDRHRSSRGSAGGIAGR